MIPTRPWMLVVFALLLASAEAFALPLRIVSETRLQLDIQETGRRPVVSGRLLDNVNQGIPEQTVVLSFYHERKRAVVWEAEASTDHLGYFTWTGPLDDGRYQVSATYPGGRHFEAAKAIEGLQVLRLPLELELDVPRIIHADGFEDELNIQLKATLPYSASTSIPIDIEAGRYTTTVQLSKPRYGVRLPMLLDDLGSRGRHPLAIHFAGDDYFPAVTLREELFVFRGPSLKFKAQTVRERSSRGLEVRGTLRSEDGPIPGGLIRVEAALRNVSTFRAIGETRSNEEGRFGAFFSEDKLPVGKIKLRVSFIPDAGQRLQSKPVDLNVEASGAGLWAMWLLGGLVALALLLVLGYFAWERLKAWLDVRRRRKKKKVSSKVAPESLGEPPPEIPASKDAIAGVLFDVFEDAPVTGAELILVSAGAEVSELTPDQVIAQARSDARGRFAMLGLPAGRMTLYAVAHGYVTGSMALTLPHRGELRYFRYSLVSVRVRVRELYQWLLEHFNPDQELWGRETPRETRVELFKLVESLRASLPPEPAALHRRSIVERIAKLLDEPGHALGELVDALTALLEEVYYSGRLHDESIVVLADALVTRLQEPIARLGAESRAQRRKRRVGGTPQRAGSVTL